MMSCPEHCPYDYCPECDEAAKDATIAKLEAVVDAAKGLVALIEETEETEDGREFHPVTISSCRVHKTAKIAEYIKAIKEVEK
jgi:hypothetical protein